MTATVQAEYQVVIMGHTREVGRHRALHQLGTRRRASG